MAEALASLVVQRLGELLSQEIDLLREVEEQVEGIQRELRLIEIPLEYVETSEAIPDGAQGWAQETRDVARSAEDLINTFLHKEAKRQRGRAFKKRVLLVSGLIYRYRVAKELVHMKLKIRDVAAKGNNFVDNSWVQQQEGPSNISQTVDSSVMNKLKDVPSLKRSLPSGMIKHIERTMDLLAKIKSVEEQDERQRIWVQEAEEVSRLVESAFESFLTARERHSRRVPLWHNLNLYLLRRQLQQKVHLINMKASEVYQRYATYGIGEFTVREEPSFKIPSTGQERSFVIFDIDSAVQSAAQVLSPWLNVDSKIDSLKRDLKLMDALFKDVGGNKDLDLRVKVWISEMEHIFLAARALENNADKQLKAGKRLTFNNVMARHKIANETTLIVNKISDLSQKKRTYDIGLIRRERGSRAEICDNVAEASTSQTNEIREMAICDNVTEVSTSQTNEIPEMAREDNSVISKKESNIPKHCHLCKGVAEQVESIRIELKLMQALSEDAKTMEQDERQKIWLKEMQDLANSMKDVIRKYDDHVEGPRLNIFKSFMIAKEINRIKNQIHNIAHWKRIYDIGGIEAQNAPKMQETRQLLCGSVEQGEANNTEEDLSRSQQVSKKGRTIMEEIISFVINLISFSTNHSINRLEEQVESMRRQLRLMRALFVDIEAMDGLQGKLKVWLDEMRDVAQQTETIIGAYEAENETGRAPIHVLMRVNRQLKIAKKIEKIKNNIEELSEIRIAHGIEHTKMKDLKSVGQGFIHRKLPSFVIDEPDNKKVPSNLMSCIFYLAMFPQEFEIPARRLTTLWVAEGIVHHKGETKETVESVAESYLTELIDRNIVEVTKKKLTGKVSKCRLPDTQRAIWLPKARKANFFQAPASTSSVASPSTAMTRRVADRLDENDPNFHHIHADDVHSSSSLRSHYKDVVSFLSFDTREGSTPGESIGNFLHRCITSRCFLRMRVLDLENVFRPKLPKALGKLNLLRYLGLRWTYLETLPAFIDKLLSLQVLDVKHTYISILPKAIWRMHELRHLYLSESYGSKFVRRPKDHSLTNLQTLWGAFINEESQVKGGLDRLLNIRKLGLACRLMSSQQEQMSSQLDAVAEWIHKLEYLQTLRLKSQDELGQPSDLHLKSLSGHTDLSTVYLLGKLEPSIVSGFPENLIDITLSASGLSVNPMESLEKLPNLKILRLLSMSFVGTNMRCSAGGFPQLHVLKLWKLEGLEKWDVEEGAMSNLRDLEIRSCTNLDMLPDELSNVRSLRKLKLSGEFTDRIKVNQHQLWERISHVVTIDTE